MWRIRSVKRTPQTRRVFRLQAGIAWNAAANVVFALSFAFDAGARAFISVGWGLALLAALISVFAAFSQVYISDERLVKRLMYASAVALGLLVVSQIILLR